MLNLLSNAVKFTPEDGQVFVELESDAVACTLRVRDTGIGIDPVLLPHVFERFVQGDAPVSPHKGLGLGLAIARHIVDAHGGTLAAESGGVMRGATFTLSLPRGDEAASMPSPSPPAV